MIDTTEKKVEAASSQSDPDTASKTASGSETTVEERMQMNQTAQSFRST